MARKKSASKKAREQAIARGEEVPKNIEEKEVEKEEVKLRITNSSDEEASEVSSESEEEDEYGELITDDVEEGINKVLNAIKTGDKLLFDPSVKFFDEDAEKLTKEKKKDTHKPIYLKDYHRMNLLSGEALKDDEEDGAQEWADGEKPYAIQQLEDKSKLLSEIRDAFGDDEDGEGQGQEEDDEFLTKKEVQREVRPLRVLPVVDSKDEEKFLSAYMDSHAWIPTKDSKEIDLDARDDDEFDDAVEKFEHAYNFRFEDPNSAEIVSYARNQATLRRSKTNARKQLREKEREQKEQEKLKKEAELNKKKLKKINMVTDRLLQIKEAVGGDVSDELITKVFGDSLLEEDFDDAEWDAKMAQIFDEAYYGAEVKKPDFGDDDEIMKDFELDESEDDEEEEEEEVGASGEEAEEKKEEEQIEDTGVDIDSSKASKKDKLKDKKSKKKEKEQLKKAAEKIVIKNTSKLVEELEEEQRGRSKEEDIKFKYREVSPESFGLTTREILSAQDKDLNELIGIKKFAPYRPRELRVKDKRKLTKSYKLKEWKRQVFKNPDGLKDEEGLDFDAGKKRKHKHDHHDKKDKSSKKHKKEKKDKKDSK